MTHVCTLENVGLPLLAVYESAVSQDELMPWCVSKNQSLAQQAWDSINQHAAAQGCTLSTTLSC